MNRIDRYHHWVEWSDENGVYLGLCPDLITGIHGEEPEMLYRELRGVLEEVLQMLDDEGRTHPPARTRSVAAVA